MITVTGASGRLGRLVVERLLDFVPAAQITAAVRSPDKVRDLADRGVQVRHADYDQPVTLADAFHGEKRLLLISASEVGRRVPQHRAVIDAVKKEGVDLIAYTSILHADASPLDLAQEHRETEVLLAASGLPFVFLRNGWYTENFTDGVPAMLEQGALLGCAGDGQISSAARADYAAAAAAVLTKQDQAGRIYELAGDSACTLADVAAEVSRQSGKTVAYKNLSPEEYASAMVKAGLPEGLAALLANSQDGASKGGLFDDSKQLSGLIGRPTTSLAETVKAAL
jgi:NAD(P)H dehydrogenase (quinone)